MAKVITVFGATGQQGGSVIRIILQDENLSKEFKIRGVSRDLSKPQSRALASQGVELVLHVPHFDHKAQVEQYIRSIGVPATFVLPGYLMSNYTQFGMLRKGDDDVYTLTYPVGKDAQFPLIDITSDMARILAESEEVTGKKTRFFQVDSETYKTGQMSQEMLENHLFIESPGRLSSYNLESVFGTE
ncbi:hypothetical protein N7533_009398 [Penicillium manginii]|uniref:uncharacterized protein n=1 Tax=Penicillium manginii TaxID=203109 RepID=UPI002549B5BA|nr:uncharacterized protein N7533_009398 [Penicillium manginii]KAJ5744528.1 hypothetical protein N7533_009398 [Penicillium manginii]